MEYAFKGGLCIDHRIAKNPQPRVGAQIGVNEPPLEKSLKNNGRIPGLHAAMAEAPGLLAACNFSHEQFMATRLEALRSFTLLVIRNRGFVEPSETQAFLEAGFTQANILEVILGAAQKLMSNYTNHFAETPVDEAFQRFAWERGSAAAE